MKGILEMFIQYVQKSVCETPEQKKTGNKCEGPEIRTAIFRLQQFYFFIHVIYIVARMLRRHGDQMKMNTMLTAGIFSLLLHYAYSPVSVISKQVK